MILDRWRYSAEKLASQLPTNTQIARRAEYLLNDVSLRGVEVSASVFEDEAKLLPSEDTFLVVDRLALTRSNSLLGQMARSLAGVASVSHGKGVPSVLALPTYEPGRISGNGSILFHELEHITEKEDGLAMASLGLREDRAYQTNIDILTALDGSDFQSYVDTWPVDFTHRVVQVTPYATNTATEISFRDVDCPEPPKETFTHDLWKESGSSRIMLQSIGRTAVFKRLTYSLDKELVDKLADSLHSSS